MAAAMPEMYSGVARLSMSTTVAKRLPFSSMSPKAVIGLLPATRSTRPEISTANTTEATGAASAR